jgi:serine/threonine protein kinase
MIVTGGFGTVRLRQDRLLNKKIAVKCFYDVCQTSNFLREVGIIAKLNHPCVLRILNWVSREDPIEREIHTEFAVHGSLKNVLEKLNSGETPPFWNPAGIGILICSLVLGMRYIHSLRIIHHDLKPSNILIREKEHVWICDFGASRSEGDEPTPATETATVYYAAPELFVDRIVSTPKCDVCRVRINLIRNPCWRPCFSSF